MKQLLPLIFILFFLGACSTADTTGSSTDREYDNDIRNSGSGSIVIFSPITIHASTNQGTDQTTDNDPSNTTSPSTSLGLNGGTASLADQGSALLMEGVSSLLDASMRDNSQKTIPSPATQAAREKIVTEQPTNIETPEPVVQEGEYNTTDVEMLRPYKTKSFEWMTHTGAYYGKDVKFEFAGSCGTFVVPDASVSFAPDGSIKNHNQFIYFCGTDFPKGSAENNGGRASVFTAPGCVSTSVKIHYNK